VIIGAGLGGAAGACAGLLLALIIMAAERVLVAWLAAEAHEHGARHAPVARVSSHTSVPPAARPAASLAPAPLLDDNLLDAPLYLAATGRAQHGGSASLSA
jgi:hypothetical protein